MNTIETPSNPMGFMSLNKVICNSSIMNHPSSSSERKIEILGFYWPRLLLRSNNNSFQAAGKKDEKKVHKMKQKATKYSKNKNALSPPMKAPLSPASSSTSNSKSLLEMLHDVPALISDDHVHSRSPITGKPILSPKNKRSILVPTKPVRKHLERRSQSSSHVASSSQLG